MSHLVPAIEEWSFSSNKFCVTANDISKAFPNEKESDVLEALTQMNKSGGILLKIHLHAPISDYKPEERSSLDPLVLKRKFPKVDEVENSGERLGIQIGSDSEVVVLHPLSWRSDELMREVMKMKRIKKFLNREDFCKFVEEQWKIERTQLDIVLRYLKLQTEIRIDESRKQLDDVESTIQRVEKEIVSVPRAAYTEKRGSVSSEVDRLSTKLRFFKLWLGEQDPTSKDSLDYEKLRNSGFLA